MPKYRKKPVIVEATQWFKSGDHPEDKCSVLIVENPEEILNRGQELVSEGAVVRRYRTPECDGQKKCKHGHCEKIMHVHGWIDTLEGGHIVCPGDWIIRGVAGEYYPCKPSIFEQIYEKLETRQWE